MWRTTALTFATLSGLVGWNPRSSGMGPLSGIGSCESAAPYRQKRTPHAAASIERNIDTLIEIPQQNMSFLAKSLVFEVRAVKRNSGTDESIVGKLVLRTLRSSKPQAP